MVDDRENLDPEDKKEDSFEFDSAGETIGYISLDQARILAMCHARENTCLPSGRIVDAPLRQPHKDVGSLPVMYRDEVFLIRHRGAG